METSRTHLAQRYGFEQPPHDGDTGALQIDVRRNVQQQRQEQHAYAQHQEEQRLYREQRLL